MATFVLLGSAALGITALAARAGLRAYRRYQGALPVTVASAKKYYEGGFEPSLTKAEAALILGVRRSASVKKITEKHRKLIIANHPDRGGSPLIAAKVNQAKELLLKDVADHQ